MVMKDWGEFRWIANDKPELPCHSSLLNQFVVLQCNLQGEENCPAVSLVFF